jgi:hypothetical protein
LHFAGGLISNAAWLKFGETGGLHTGADVGPVGDLNGDGRGDFAVARPGALLVAIIAFGG